MNLPISKYSPRIASKPSARDDTPTHRAALVGVGLALAAFHEAADLKLGLPGHFGLVWMAIIMTSRQWSPCVWAATFAGLGYVGGNVVFAGFSAHALTHAPVYGGVAVAVDLAHRVLGGHLARTWVAALVGGGAFVLKPLVLFALAWTVDLEVGSLRFGPGFPLLTHFCFGMTGAVIGTLAWRASRPGNAGGG